MHRNDQIQFLKKVIVIVLSYVNAQQTVCYIYKKLRVTQQRVQLPKIVRQSKFKFKQVPVIDCFLLFI